MEFKKWLSGWQSSSDISIISDHVGRYFIEPLQQKIKDQQQEIERLKELLHNALDIED